MEATIICLDNSEWMRNGDFLPSRIIAQSDAAILLSSTKTEQNAESAVSIVSMAGKGPKVHVTLTNDESKLMNAISAVQIGGECDILATLQLAQLALKHKQNKSQRQRIILFIGSPIKAKTEDLVKMSSRLKKNNTAVDIISFGETLDNAEKLQKFHDAVNNNDNSHFLTVPPGPHNLSDYLLSFPGLLNSNASSNSDSSGNYMGFDPQMDPELATAMRLSLEESQRQSEAAASTSGESEGNNAPSTSSTGNDDMDLDDDALLQEAIRMSMMEANASASNESETKATDDSKEAPVPQAIEFNLDEDDDEAMEDDDADLYDDLDEEAQLALAMEMSMNAGNASADTKSEEKEQPKEEEPAKPDSRSLVQDALNDPSFMGSIFDNIEGVDPNDPLIQSALKGLNDKKDDEEKKD